MTDRRDRGDVLALMLKMSAGPEGLTNADLTEKLGIPQSNIAPRINGAERRGHLFRSQRQGFKIHWFDTPERAKEWAALPPPHKPKVLVTPKPQKRPTLEKKPGPPALTRYTAGASKMVSLKADAPVDASGAKFTKCPSGMDYRFTPAPEEVQPVFSSMGIGRYLEVRA